VGVRIRVRSVDQARRDASLEAALRAAPVLANSEHAGETEVVSAADRPQTPSGSKREVVIRRGVLVSPGRKARQPSRQ
jgi:hypothetical protein